MGPSRSVVANMGVPSGISVAPLGTAPPEPLAVVGVPLTVVPVEPAVVVVDNPAPAVVEVVDNPPPVVVVDDEDVHPATSIASASTTVDTNSTVRHPARAPSTYDDATASSPLRR